MHLPWLDMVKQEWAKMRDNGVIKPLHRFSFLYAKLVLSESDKSQFQKRKKRISASSRRVTCNKHMLMYVCSFWIGHFLSAQIRQLGRYDFSLSKYPLPLIYFQEPYTHICACIFSPCLYWVYILLYIYSSLLTI